MKSVSSKKIPLQLPVAVSYRILQNLYIYIEYAACIGILLSEVGRALKQIIMSRNHLLRTYIDIPVVGMYGDRKVVWIEEPVHHKKKEEGEDRSRERIRNYLEKGTTK